MRKCQIVSIRCMEDQVVQAIAVLPGQMVIFPIKYLGLPLLVSKLPKCALQLLIHKMVDWLPAWQGRLMHRCGRLTLIKTMLAMTLVYTGISFHLPWFLKSMTHIFKVFLWLAWRLSTTGNVWWPGPGCKDPSISAGWESWTSTS
jgi:hypothetical protein